MYQNTVDVSSQSGCHNLNLDDFVIISAQHAQVQNGSLPYINKHESLLLSYDASTCTLTTGQSADWGKDNYSNFYWNYILFAVGVKHSIRTGNSGVLYYGADYVYTGSHQTITIDVSNTERIYYRLKYGIYTNASTSVSSTNNIIPSGTSTVATNTMKAEELFSADLQEGDTTGINTLSVTFTSSGGNYGSWGLIVSDQPW